MTLSDAIALYNYKFGVIYRIYCDQTGCSYVGQTRDINKNQRLSRIKSHYAALKKGCHPCSKLQAAWDATGGESIKDEILEVIAPVNKNVADSNEKMIQAEKRWQEVYDCHQNTSASVDRYYALKAGELKKLRDAGIINNATFVYFILKLKNPWCDRPLHIKPLELSIEWDIPESSVYEAIAKLKDSELVTIEQAEIVLRWNSPADSQQDSPLDSQQDVLSGNSELLRDFRIDSEIPESITENQNGLRDSRIDSEIPENHQPESLQGKDSKNPHTIQTYSDFKDSLSEDQREEFLKFGENKAAQLPQPPTLPRRWVENNWQELSAQWYKSKGKSSPAQNSKWETDPRRADWLAIIEETANPLEFAVGDAEKLDFVRWCKQTKQFSWLRGEL
ncbi:GIY-YIG nuclease family protein [Anabaena sp. UHCC 0399]|uniref:GIY-YIG nuclease family protein n=1 Tax=Anabaena sp. UHCC 0399 TaxID=3110238 RepID=UPI002B2114A3|nr:GIY-YIG nuclease family protein [Anabaena sp. UHCC 0399]MEA5569150.1 GIY-YIG nuclease family protein [Anabaena sp. UHCC 0399]